MVENFINRIIGDPILLTIAAVIVIVAIIFIIKKLVKIGFSLIVLAAIVLAITYFTSDDPKDTIEKAIGKGQELYDDAKEKTKEFTEDVEDVKKDLEDKIPND